MTVIAISAAYGASGQRIGQDLAGRLGVPFVDRVISAKVAGELEVSLAEAEHQWEPPSRSFLERVLASFHGVDTGAPVGPPPASVSPEDFRRAAEKAVIEQADTGGGVILGRGAVPALRDRPNVLRVRLDGPPERRLEQSMRVSGMTEDETRAAMIRLDNYHASYMREFYDVDIKDPALYHLSLDATAFDIAACVELIELAARAICRG